MKAMRALAPRSALSLQTLDIAEPGPGETPDPRNGLRGVPHGSPHRGRVANLTRVDGERFMQIARQVRLKVHVTPYRLDDANQALADLRHGTREGAAVLIP